MKNSKKITLLFIVSVSLLMVISGCSPRRISNNITTPQTGRSNEISTLYQNTLRSLVSEGAITQAQSDKVLTEVTNKNNRMIDQRVTPGNVGDGTITPNQANNQIGTGTANRTAAPNGTVNPTGAATPNGTVNPNGTVTPSEAVTPNGTRTGTENDRLNTINSKVDLNVLVSNGTLTQAQANIINQRITEAMKNNQTK